MADSTKITPFLWFDDNAEEAVNYYIETFGDARLLDVHRKEDGSLFYGAFELYGRRYMVLNGGPHYKLNEAFSMFVSCDDQAEVDRLWGRLTYGGKPSMCGWLTDRFGLTWQIIPSALMRFVADPDPARAERARQAMYQMQKIDIAAIERAADGK